ncbi:MAG: bifunctional diguanylate cyclase/phosphodiesterase [Pseudomonadota bacterium]
MRRISIRRSAPLIAMLVSGFVSIVFLGLHVASDKIVSAKENQALAAELAAALAPDVSARAVARIEHLLSTQTDSGAVIDQNGITLAGDPASLMHPEALRTPIIETGTQIGTLVALPRSHWVTPMTWYMQVALALFGLTAGYLVASFYAERVSDALDDLSLQADEDKVVDAIDFVELSRLRTSMRRARSRVSRQKEALEMAAWSDLVTGLPNAASASKRLESLCATANFERPAALTLLRFQNTRGEAVGSYNGGTLHSAAAVRINTEIETFCRENDVPREEVSLHRISGDQLVILIGMARDRNTVSTLLRGVLRAMRAPFELDGRLQDVRLHGGVAMIPEDTDQAKLAIERAERAYHTARETSDAGIKFYTPRLDRIEQAKLNLEAELRDGVAKDEFVAAFQPKIDFKTGRVAGFEALARWQRGPDRMISPGVFIPLAEETGLIQNIGDSILRQACTEAAYWQRMGHPIPIAVNVAALQLEKEKFVESVVDALRESGLPPKLLELEITETMAVADARRVADVMRPLRAMGVRLAIDDFGTGHSNLSILTQLPFTTFKIDRQFVSALDKSSEAPAIIEMILAMAETLGLETVAEGIETPHQADFLRRRGCQMAQGFLYSRAVSADDALSCIKRFEADVDVSQRAVGQA